MDLSAWGDEGREDEDWQNVYQDYGRVLSARRLVLWENAS